MTIQFQVTTFIPRDYDVFGGLDVDKHSIAVTFCNHEGVLQCPGCWLQVAAPLLQSSRRLVKRRRALLESNPPRNSQLETHRVERRGRDHGCARAGQSKAARLDRFPNALENSCLRLSHFQFQETTFELRRRHIAQG